MSDAPRLATPDQGSRASGWKEVGFFELFERRNGKAHQVQARDYREFGRWPVVDQGQKLVVGYADDERRVLHAPPGGLVVFGDHTRIVKFVDFDFLVGADGTQLLFPKAPNDPRFLYYLLDHTDIPSAGYSRHMKFLTELRFCVPDPNQQAAIGAALQDVDRLIDSAAGLASRKRAVTQGAAQELLTGRTRLPGFTREWSSVPVSSLGQTYGGLSGKSKEHFDKGNARFIPFTAVIENVVVPTSDLPVVSVSAGESQNEVLAGDLLFNSSSEVPDELALCAVVSEVPEGTFLNSFCFGFRLHSETEADGLFLAYLFRSGVGRDMLRALAQGAIRYNLSKAQFRQLDLLIPAYDEQQAISALLSDMDAEVAAIEAEAAKLADVKVGMMQELLSASTVLSSRSLHKEALAA